MIGDGLDWPASLPTNAVLTTLTHVLEHHHKGVSAAQHFIAVLREEVGLQDRKPA